VILRGPEWVRPRARWFGIAHVCDPSAPPTRRDRSCSGRRHVGAIHLGVGWLVVGIVYLAILTRGLRQAPPEMSIDAPAERLVPAAD
jgi:hypothetical protein